MRKLLGTSAHISVDQRDPRLTAEESTNFLAQLQAMADQERSAHADTWETWRHGARQPNITAQYVPQMWTRALRDARLPHSARTLVSFIASLCGKHGWINTTSRQLAAVMKCSQRHIFRLLAFLRRHGYVKSQTRCNSWGETIGLRLFCSKKILRTAKRQKPAERQGMTEMSESNNCEINNLVKLTEDTLKSDPDFNIRLLSLGLNVAQKGDPTVRARLARLLQPG